MAGCLREIVTFSVARDPNEMEEHSAQGSADLTSLTHLLAVLSVPGALYADLCCAARGKGIPGAQGHISLPGPLPLAFALPPHSAVHQIPAW